jgi:micrococcal nuclease
MKRLAIHLLLILLLSTPAVSEVLVGQVISVADGDTITILDSSKMQHKIRLYGIDTPEKSQAYGNKAKSYTASLTFKKTANVVVMDTDRYGRTVGVVVVDGINVNQSIIEAGYAWQYGKYCKESFCSDWLRLEQKARSSRKGLWASPQPTEPWNYRKNQRSAKKLNKNFSRASGGYHGNVDSHVFHGSSCRHYNCKNCIKSFENKQEALHSGYRPHRECVD